MSTMQDLIIRVMGDGSQFRRDIQNDQREVNHLVEQMNGIHGSLATIRVDDAESVQKVEELQRKLAAINDRTARVNINTAEGQAELAQIRTELGDLHNETIDIHVSDASAVLELNNLRSQLDSLHNRRIHITEETTRTPSSGGGGGVGTGAAAAGGLGPLAGLIMTALPLLSPLSAVATGGVMGLASAFVGAGAGAAGFGAVAIPVIKSVTDATSNLQKAQKQYEQATNSKQRVAALKKEQQAMDGLSTSQIKASHSLVSFENFWHSFTKSFQNPVLDLFSQSLDILKNILIQFKPVIMTVADSFSVLLNGLQTSVNAGSFKAFFKYLNDYGSQAIIDLGDIFGNVVGGIMNLMIAFGDTSTSMTAGLSNMTGAFEKWTAGLSQTKGFKDFINYLNKNGPVLLATLGNLIKAVVNILVDLAPLGAVMLTVIQGFTKWLATFTKINPEITTMVASMVALVGVWGLLKGPLSLLFKFGEIITIFKDLKAAMVGLSLAEKAVAVGEALMDSLNPIGWIVLIIAAVGILVIEIVKHWSQIAKFTIQIWNSIATFFTKWGTTIYKVVSDEIKRLVVSVIKYWHQIEKTTLSIWNEIINSLVKLWNGIVKDAKGLLKNIENIWNNLVKGAEKAWRSLVTSIEKAWKSLVKGAIESGKNLENSAKNTWTSLTHWVKSIWNAFVHWITSSAMTLANGVINAFKWLYNHNYYIKDLVDFIKKMWGIARKDAETIWKDITTFIPKMWNELTHKATAAWNSMTGYITKKWDEAEKITSSVWKNITGYLTGLWNGLVNLGKSAWNSMTSFFTSKAHETENNTKHTWNSVSSFLTSLWHSISNLARSVWSSITNYLLSQWRQTKAEFTLIWTVLKNVALSVWHSIVNAARAIWTPIETFFSRLWNNIRNRISSAWNAIRGALSGAAHSAINAVENAFSGLWSMAYHWGSNMVHGFVSGIENMIGSVRSAAGNVMHAAARFLGFHSPSAEGPGQHIVTWGENMIHGFTDGIQNAAPHLRSVMDGVIQAPNLAVSSNVAQMVNGSLSSRQPFSSQRGMNSNHYHNDCYSFNISLPNATVRSDEDIKNIAYQLKLLQDKTMRAQGVIT